MEIVYLQENELSTAEFIQILAESTLAERRPIHDFERMELMMKHCNLVITARHEGELVGVARSWSDFYFTTYLFGRFGYKRGLSIERHWKRVDKKNKIRCAISKANFIGRTQSDRLLS